MPRSIYGIALEEYEEDRNIEAFLLVLRDVLNAQGGTLKVRAAYQTSVARSFTQSSLKSATLQFKTFEAMGAILHGLGFKFSIETLENSP